MTFKLLTVTFCVVISYCTSHPQTPSVDKVFQLNHRVEGVAVDRFGNTYTTGYRVWDYINSSDGRGRQNSYGGFFVAKCAPNGSVLWDRPAGINHQEVLGVAVAVDDIGNVYVTGEFIGTISFGLTTFFSERVGLFTIKYDSSGVPIWSRRVGGGPYSEIRQDEVGAMAVDQFQNVYIIGRVNGSILVMKYDSNGNLVWQRSSGNSTEQWVEGSGISVDQANNVIVSGNFAPPVTFGSITLGGFNFLVKYDSSGALLWARNAVDGHTSSGSVATDRSNNISLTCGYNEFGYPFDVLLIKYNSLGSPLWTVTSASSLSGDSRGEAVTTDVLGNVYIGGTFEYNLTMGSVTLNGIWQQNLFAAKFNPAGVLQWATTTDEMTGIPEPLTNRADGVAVDGSGGLYFAGAFDGWSIRFGSTTLQSEGGNGFVVKMEGQKMNTRFYHQILSVPEFSTAKLMASSLNGTVAKICADSSQSTLITFKGDSAVTFRIAQDLTGLDPGNYGHFGQLVPVSIDSVFVRYTHPASVNPDSLTRHLKLEVVRKNSNEVIDTSRIEIYRAPVVMVHGIWSNSSTFFTMNAAFIGQLFPNPSSLFTLTSIADYRETNGYDFYTNEFVVPSAVKGVITSVRSEGYSAGRADVVAHSMGALLARLYIQSPTYQNDIYRLITIDSPHSGTQAANIILDPRAIGSKELLSIPYFGKDFSNGAVHNLQVNSLAIRYLNEGAYRSNRVGLHSIICDALFEEGTFSERALIYAAKKDFLFAFPYQFLGAAYANDFNDLIVPAISQQGGADLWTSIHHQSHSGASENQNVIDRVVDLLKNGSQTGQFSWDGFQPVELQPPTFTLTPVPTADLRQPNAKNKNLSSVSITSPANGSTFNSGEPVHVIIGGTNDVSNISLFAGNPTTDAFWGEQNGTTAIFDFDVPNTAVGQLGLVAMAYSDSGYVAMDTIQITVVPNSVLDSIRVNPSNIHLPVGQKTSTTVTGFYHDNIQRNVSYLSGLTYQSGNSSVAQVSGAGTITGIFQDTTTIIVTYQSQSTAVRANILSSNAWQEPPATPQLEFPTDQSTVHPTQNVLRWLSVNQADYQLQVSLRPDFATTAIDQSSLLDTSFSDPGLSNDTIYYWRVRAANLGGSSPWSNAWSFRTDTSMLIALSVNLEAGWNLISNPVTVTNDSVRILYPSSSFAQAYAFNPLSGYVQSYTMPNGSGYWEKFPSTTSNIVSGLPRTQDSINVSIAWNIVGSISSVVDTNTIASVPLGLRGSPWFGYGVSGYSVVTQLVPGKAYWIKSNGFGKFVLLAQSASTEPNGTTRIEGLTSLNTVTIIDSKGFSQTLYFGTDVNEEIPKTFYNMPPVPPAGAFDARFETSEGGLMVQTYSEGDSNVTGFPLVIQSDSYPVTVSWKVKNGSYELGDGVGGTIFNSKEMRHDGSLRITNSTICRVVVKLVGKESLPKEFALTQNYPNPFNPVTTIKYELPSDTRVQLKLYNLLGQEIATLIDEAQKAGYKSVEWNAGNVATGVYFYRLQAGDFTDVKKMLLVK